MLKENDRISICNIELVYSDNLAPMTIDSSHSVTKWS